MDQDATQWDGLILDRFANFGFQVLEIEPHGAVLDDLVIAGATKEALPGVM